MISSYLLVPARVPGLVSLLFFFFSQEEDCVPSWFSGSFWFRARAPGLVSLLFLRFFSQEWGTQWIFFCAWTSWKHGSLLFGVYAGVMLWLRQVFNSINIGPLMAFLVKQESALLKWNFNNLRQFKWIQPSNWPQHNAFGYDIILWLLYDIVDLTTISVLTAHIAGRDNSLGSYAKCEVAQGHVARELYPGVVVPPF